MSVTNPRVGLDELMATPEFALLTKKQQVFVAVLIVLGSMTGDYNAEEAASLAYGTVNGQVLGLELMQQSKIKRVLDIHFRRDPMDSLLSDLHRAIKKALRKSTPPEQARAELGRVIEFYERESGKRKAGIS